MNKYIKFSAPFVFLISLILILAFKTLPSGKLWKEYSVICVPSNTSDSIVISALTKAGIENYVSLSGQYLPINLSDNSIELSLLRLNLTNNENTYINKRNAMFFDKSQAYRLYYIPEKYGQEITYLIKNLENQGIECRKDSSANYPWLLPFITLLLAIMLFLFVKNKPVYITGSVMPLLYLYCNPFYPAATATCLSLLCIFFTSNVWKRKGALSSLLSRHSAPVLLAIALISSFSISLFAGLLFISAIAATIALLISFSCLEDFIRNRKPFVPVYIRSAKRVSLFAGKAFISMSLVTASVSLLIILIFITSSTSIKSSASNSKLLFPGSTAFSDSSLPQFEEYYKWNWEVKTAPYKSLNSTSSDEKENTVTFSSFVENENTGIISEKKNILKYDDSFKKQVYEEIDSLQFDSVEKIMKSEGENFNGGYTAASSYQITLFGIIMCFICLFILLFIYFSIIIRKGINK